MGRASRIGTVGQRSRCHCECLAAPIVRENLMPDLIYIVIVVLVVLALLGYFGRGRFRG